MKTPIIIFIFLTVLNSCSKDDGVTTDSTGYYGKWTLVAMSGSILNSETTGAAMEWQEFYFFNTNGTFIKSRESNSVKTSISGTYTTTIQSDGTSFELTYPNDSEIIGSCFGNKKEILLLTANNSLSNTWNFCDGPSLKYRK
jgi:hypothetical protein